MPTQEAIYQKVSATLVEALNVDEDEIQPTSTLQGDLGAESIDFLDIVFRLEREFGIKIPRGELFPGQGLAPEAGPGDLGEHDLLPEVVGLAHEDAAGLGQPFQQERRGHDRVTGEVVGEVVLRQAQVLDGPGLPPAVELQESVDPEPTHGMERKRTGSGDG